MKFMKMFSKKQVVVSGLLSALMVSSAWATTAGGGVTGTEFQALFDMLVGWAEGYLGKALAIAAFVVGALIGFAKSTAMPALVGIVFAIVFGLGPTIINGMFAAVI
ncbi:MAG TPA: TraA family conjugative transfer protein [Thiobacillus sp.]|jgi:conjugal transfer pilus assembly protein TraA|uniref:TraA family conjugative transfer protein n=1 Tax=Thiobacillus denitrificans TaxID=36861 RepID=UPI00036E0D72|nr:TraA family conjugative transfer protein [Thiobacillus denitrificans]